MMRTVLKANMQTAVLVTSALAFLFLEGCGPKVKEKVLSGEAQGTTYELSLIHI